MRSLSLRPIILSLSLLLGVLAQTGTGVAGKKEVIVLAGGCFWCVESDFESVPGVTKAISGFTGGTLDNPTYKQVTKGGTGHYEAVQITYDTAKVTYDELLNLFLRSIDPTDAGGQFCDRGDSYRTAIFVSNKAEEAAAQAAIATAQAKLGRSIVTPVLPATKFFKAEKYHQDYYKSSKIVLTRNGPKTKASAYKFYRSSCGRDARVNALWGNSAPFIGH
jgi:peptide-methionine (S)-S-oxide reductase